MAARAAVPWVHHVGPLNPPSHQGRQMATVVQVRMAENNIGDRLGVNWQRLPVQATPRALTLVQAAVHQGSAPVPFEKELAAGDGARGAQEGEGGDHGVLRFLVAGGGSPSPGVRSGLFAYGRHGKPMPVGRAVVVLVALKMCGGVNDGNGAVRPVHDASAHRTEEEAGEPTAAASANDHKAGVLALADQSLRREPADAVSAHFDIGIPLLPPSQGLGDQDLLLLCELLPVDGPDGGGRGAFDVLQPPGVNDIQAYSA